MLKRGLISIAVILVIVAAFFLGRGTAFEKESMKCQADGILAYQHYFEAAENILAVDEAPDSASWANYAAAKQHITSYLEGTPLTWPEIVDQRDKLSDAIRCYHDNNPDSDILEYVSQFGTNPENLSFWAYSY